MGIGGAGIPLFVRIREIGISPDQGTEREDGVPIPDGWLNDYFLGRPTWEGLCKWSDLCDGTLTIDDVVSMHRILNLKEYLERESQNSQE